MSTNTQDFSNCVCLRFNQIPPSFAEVEQNCLNSRASSVTAASSSSAATTTPSLADAAGLHFENKNWHYKQQSKHQNEITAPIRATYPRVSEREKKKIQLQQEQEHSVFLPFMDKDPSNNLQQQQQQQYQAAVVTNTHNNIIIPPFSTSEQQKQQQKTVPPPTTSSSAIADLVYQKHQPQHQQQSRNETQIQQQQQRQRPLSARGTKYAHMHTSNIQLAGPDNCEVSHNKNDYQISGIPRMGCSRHQQQPNNNNTKQQRASSCQPCHYTNNFVEQQQQQQQQKTQIPTTARRASSECRPASCCNNNKNQPGVSAGPQVSTSDSLKVLLSRETLNIRKSQRFQNTPRCVQGDHLSGSGAGLIYGRTSRSSAFTLSDETATSEFFNHQQKVFDARNKAAAAEHQQQRKQHQQQHHQQHHQQHQQQQQEFVSDDQSQDIYQEDSKTGKRHVAYTSSQFRNNNINDNFFSPPVPCSNAFVYHRHRPSTARVATNVSEPTTLEEELKTNCKKRHVDANHIDAQEQRLNVLQPWAKNENQNNKKKLALQDVSNRNNNNNNPHSHSGIRSTSQQFYDKSFELKKNVPSKDLVNYGEGLNSRDELKQRMLNTSSPFW